MKFRTEVSVSPQDNAIGYHSKIFLLGSCFVENIGEKLDLYQFQNYKNPFGILYHPSALENFLRKVVEGYKFTSADIFYHNERWHCFDAHSELSDEISSNLIEKLNVQLQHSRSHLNQTSHIILTLGTAWKYYHLKTETSVANCHKLPQKEFAKQLMSVEEITAKLHSIQSLLFKLNSNIQLIYTLSPVRHLRDGVLENQLSKAHLLTAIHENLKINKDGDLKVDYFPSYEIMMDDLRDYRFYKEDMLHPNNTAISYIWNKFLDAWVLPKELDVMKKVETIQRGLNHRPFNENSEAHKKFISQLRENIDLLVKDHSWMRF